jgi:hypothetical protein
MRLLQNNPQSVKIPGIKKLKGTFLCVLVFVF